MNNRKTETLNNYTRKQKQNKIIKQNLVITNLLFFCLSVCLFVCLFWGGHLTELTVCSSVEFGVEKGIVININSYEELAVMTDIMKELR